TAYPANLSPCRREHGETSICGHSLIRRLASCSFCAELSFQPVAVVPLPCACLPSISYPGGQCKANWPAGPAPLESEGCRFRHYPPSSLDAIVRLWLKGLFGLKHSLIVNVTRARRNFIKPSPTRLCIERRAAPQPDRR